MYTIIIDNLDFMRGPKVYVLDEKNQIVEELRVPNVEKDLPILLKGMVGKYKTLGILLKGPIKLSKNLTAFLLDEKIKIEYLK